MTDSDLFEREQRIYDKAAERLDEMQKGGSYSDSSFRWEELVREYSRMLKHLRREQKAQTRLHMNL